MTGTPVTVERFDAWCWARRDGLLRELAELEAALTVSGMLTAPTTQQLRKAWRDGKLAVRCYNNEEGKK